MKRFVTIVSLLAVLMLGTFTVAGAATPFVLFYDLAGVSISPEDTLDNGVSSADGIQALELGRGDGVNRYGLTNGFSANGWNMDDPSLETALATGAYFQFGLRIEPGYTASLSSLDLSLRRSAKNSPMNYALYISLNDFETPGMRVAEWQYFGRTSGSAPSVDRLAESPYYYMENDLAGRPNATTSPGDPIPTIALDGPDVLQNLPGGTVVTFRLYAWGNNSTAGSNTVGLGRMQGPRIEGTVSAD